MEIKVKKATGSKAKTTTQIQLPIADLPDRIQARVKRDVGEYIVESVLKTVAGAESPVKGEDWPALSTKYKAKKEAEGLAGEANMEFEGDMLDSLSFEETRDGVEVGIFGKEAWKADGHLKFSGEEGMAPRRRFLPGEGQEFDSAIQDGIEEIILGVIGDETKLDRQDFNAVSTKAELYSVLSEYFPDLARAEIKQLVVSAPSMVAFLDDLSLLELL